MVSLRIFTACKNNNYWQKYALKNDNIFHFIILLSNECFIGSVVKSGFAIFTRRVTWNYAYSPFKIFVFSSPKTKKQGEAELEISDKSPSVAGELRFDCDSRQICRLCLMAEIRHIEVFSSNQFICSATGIHSILSLFNKKWVLQKKSLKYGLKTFELASIMENILWIELNIVTLCQCLGSRSVGSTRFCFLDPLKFADPQIRIQGENINLKLLKKNLFLSKPQIWTIEKRD